MAIKRGRLIFMLKQGKWKKTSIETLPLFIANELRTEVNLVYVSWDETFRPDG